MSDYNDNDRPKGLSKVGLAFIGSFFSLLLAFIAKDYFAKAGYIWVVDKESQRPYLTILKTVVDDDVYKRIRIADNVPVEKNQPKNQPTSSNDGHFLRMQNLLNNLGPIETIKGVE